MCYIFLTVRRCGSTWPTRVLLPNWNAYNSDVAWKTDGTFATSLPLSLKRKQHLHQIGRGWPSPKGKDIVLQQNQFSGAFPVRFKGEYVLNDNFWKEKKLGGCDFWREMTHYSTASWGGDFF